MTKYQQRRTEIKTYQEILSEHHYETGKDCLVWAAHHEHAVFSITDPIHPAAVIVHFQLVTSNEPYLITEKHERKNDVWTLIEYSDIENTSELILTNNNPFCPIRKHHEKTSFKNWAFSVFPQNQHWISGAEPVEVVWQREYPDWEVYPPIPLDKAIKGEFLDKI